MTIKSKLNTTIYGGILRYPVSDPEVIIAEGGLYAKGVLMDANSVESRIEEHAKKHDVDTNTIMKRIDDVVSAQEQENQSIKLSISDTNKRITDLIGASPEQLDTIYELAMAIDNDAQFVSTVNNKFTDVNTKLKDLKDYTEDQIGALAEAAELFLLLFYRGGCLPTDDFKFTAANDNVENNMIEWSVNQPTVNINFDDETILIDPLGYIGSFELPYATTTTAGAMSSEDKSNIDKWSGLYEKMDNVILNLSFGVNERNGNLLLIVKGNAKYHDGTFLDTYTGGIDIPQATTISDGVMSKEDKLKLNQLSTFISTYQYDPSNPSYSHGVTRIDFKSNVTDKAFIDTTVTGDRTVLAMNISDDTNDTIDFKFIGTNATKIIASVTSGGLKALNANTNTLENVVTKSELDKTSDKLDNLSLYYTFLKTSNSTGTKIKTLLKEGEEPVDFIRNWVDGDDHINTKIYTGDHCFLNYRLPNPKMDSIIYKMLDDSICKWNTGELLFGDYERGGAGLHVDKLYGYVHLSPGNTGDAVKTQLLMTPDDITLKNNHGKLLFSDSEISLEVNSGVGGSILRAQSGNLFQINRSLIESELNESAKDRDELKRIIHYYVTDTEEDSHEDISPHLSYYGWLGDHFIECRKNYNRVILPQTTFDPKDAVNKEYVDNLVNPLQYDYYGIKWTTNASGVMTSNPVRTGNLAWHKSLPIQSEMKRCTLLDDGTVNGYISDSDYTKYTDGRTVDYTGADGLVMVEIPEYYFKAINEQLPDGTYVNELRLYPYSKQGVKSKKFYTSVSHAMGDVAGVGADNAKLYSVCKTNFTVDSTGTVNASNLTYTSDAANFKGGGRSTDYADDSVKSLLGRPLTLQTLATYRIQAMRRGDGWSLQYWNAYEAIVRLYVVEYCSFNSQADYNPNLTVEGYHQGGLGAGVTTVDYANWKDYNKNNPLIPSLITKSLGNKTGIISFKYDAGTLVTNAFTLLVPSYRGIENIFGHLWTFCDGIAIYGDSTRNKSYIYTCSDLTKFKNIAGSNAAPEGYILACESPVFGKSSYITGVNWNESGEFIPTSVGGTADTYYTDNFWSGTASWKLLFLGGSAGHHVLAGLLAFNGDSGFGHTLAHVGARLYYTPLNSSI